MAHYVPDSAVDHDAVLRRGGANCGDEDFAIFKCPECSFVYLLDYEVDTVYLDGTDLTRRKNAAEPSCTFSCTHCHKPFPPGIWAGPKADEKFLVTWEELKGSPWQWVAQRSTAFGDPAKE